MPDIKTINRPSSTSSRHQAYEHVAGKYSTTTTSLPRCGRIRQQQSRTPPICNTEILSKCQYARGILCRQCRQMQIKSQRRMFTRTKQRSVIAMSRVITAARARALYGTRYRTRRIRARSEEQEATVLINSQNHISLCTGDRSDTQNARVTRYRREMKREYR